MQALVAACAQSPLADWVEVVLIHSDQAEAGGLAFAQAQGLATLVQVKQAGEKRQAYDQRLLAALAPYQLDWILLAGYMRILSADFVAAYLGRILNIHPADTKVHQGLAGYAWAWEQGLASTKITVHYVDAGLDSGAIIAQADLSLAGLKSLAELEQKGLALEHALYPQAFLQALEADDPARDT